MEDYKKKVSFVLVYDPKVISQKAGDSIKSFSCMDLSEIKPYTTFILIILDYFGIYIPMLWLDRFHYLKNIIRQNPWKTSPLFITENEFKVIDLTEDLCNCFYKTEDCLDFSFFPECIFYIFQGHSSFHILRQRQMIRFLMPFIEFLGPCSIEVENWRRKSQNINFSILSTFS